MKRYEKILKDANYFTSTEGELDAILAFMKEAAWQGYKRATTIWQEDSEGLREEFETWWNKEIED